MKEEEEDITGVVPLSDDEESLAEDGGILLREECMQEGNWMGGTSTFDNAKPAVAPYLPTPVPSTIPLACMCAAIVPTKAATLSPTNLPPVVNSLGDIGVYIRNFSHIALCALA